MSKTFLIIGFRNLIRHKLFSFINIFGLALGLASGFILVKYVAYELSFDGFHSNAAQTYRLTHSVYQNGSLEFSEALNWYGVAPAIRDNFPEVTNVVRIHRADGMISYHNFKNELISYHEKNAFYADSTFFSIFSFPLVTGDVRKVLRNPSAVLVSESTAKRYFGSDNPVGKTLSLSTEWEGGEYRVEGVFRDVPENSHIKFDFLFSIPRLLSNNQFKWGAWYWTNFYTYLLLKPGADAHQLERKLQVIIDKNLGKELKAQNRQIHFALQPLEDIHLRSDVGGELEEPGNFEMISFLLIIAFIVVSVAWLNYINLSTAKATERAREVGIRKVVGSKKIQLVRQFLLESLLVAALAVMVATILVIALTPVFTSLIGKAIPLDIGVQPSFWLGAVVLVAAGTFLSALYPAFVMASFDPLRVLKGKLLSGQSGRLLRRSLVVFQFSASLCLIIATLTVYRQLAFMRAQDLGMSISQKLIVRAPRVIEGGGSYMIALDRFKDRLKPYPGVISVTTSSAVPGKEIFWGNFIQLIHNADQTEKPSSLMAVDEDFIPTFGMTLLAGRNFSKDRVSDLGNTVIINEAALRLLDMKNPEMAVDQDLLVANSPKKIIGVVRDFHQQSLQHTPTQLVLQFIPWHNDYVTIAVSGADVRTTVETVKKVYQQVFAENAFDYFFLDDQYNAQYRSEEQSSEVFGLFAMLSIVVSRMGLFGLASFLTVQRSKEIAMRKILGASVANVTLMASRDFIRPVLVAFALGTPVAWWLMTEWLNNYPYRVSLPWWIFAFAGLLMLVIALMSVGYNAVRVATTNPVKAIKAE